MKPLEYSKTKEIFKAEVSSGNFHGSPIVMTYHLDIADELIQSLKIMGQRGMANFSRSFLLKI